MACAKVDYLHNKPCYIDELVSLLWSEWSHDFITLTPYKTPELLKHFYAKTSHTIPTAYVIYDADTGAFIGTGLVDVEDMGVHPECSPWLASICIKPEYRDRGYASILVRRIIDKYPLLHLWTFNERLANFYKRFGFKIEEIIPKHGDHENVIYMRLDKT